MKYRVRFVQDADLPEGVDWTFATQGGRTFLFVKESAINPATGKCDALTSAWERWQAAQVEPPPRVSLLRSEIGHFRTVAAILLAGYGITAVKVGAVVF